MDWLLARQERIEAALARRASIVAPARRPEDSRQEAGASGIAFDMITTPTPLQQHAFDLLGVSYRL